MALVIGLISAAPGAYAAAGDPDSPNGQIIYNGQNPQIAAFTASVNDTIQRCRSGRGSPTLLNRLRNQLNSIAFSRAQLSEQDIKYLAEIYAGSFEMELFC
ncbi:MAG: hypothetical protein KI792_08905 [Alphaproteobacteria bacterium]|nr:hypothetical protein [Alphaproteobacteria bacterium SS10]